MNNLRVVFVGQKTADDWQVDEVRLLVSNVAMSHSLICKLWTKSLNSCKWI